MTGILRAPRRAALAAISLLVAAASLASLAESYRGLFIWAEHHGLTGIWAAGFPAQVDTFLVVGELALFVGLADRWPIRSRVAAWGVTLLGLGVSVAGNVGHVAGHSLTVRATAAVPPLAAAAALAVGLGVLKRVVQAHHQAVPAAELEAPRTLSTELVPVPTDNETAATAALAASIPGGNPLSQNQLMTRFRLTRAQATKLRRSVLAEANGHPLEIAP